MSTMKIRVDRATLAEAAAWVAQAISKKPGTAAMGGLHLVAVDNRLTLSAFDYEASHQATISAEVVTDGEAVLPGHMLRDLAAAMKPVEVELVTDEHIATLSAGRANYRLPVLRLDDWPSLPKPATEVGTLTADDLAGAVKVVRHAVDDASPTESVRGVMMTTAEAGGGLRVVGLRGTVMSTCVVDWAGKDMTARVPVAQIEAALKGLSGTIGLAEVDGLLTMSDDARVVTIRCYAGDYARWTQLFRDSSPVTAGIDAEEFAGAVKRVTLTQPRDAAGVAVRVTVRPDEVEVGVADDATEVLDADVTGLDDGAERTVGLGSLIVGSAMAGLSGPVVIGIAARDAQGIEFRMADDSSVHYLAPRRLLER